MLFLATCFMCEKENDAHALHKMFVELGYHVYSFSKDTIQK